MTLMFGGLAAGLTLALAAATLVRHSIAGVLMNVGVTDPLSFTAAALFLVGVGFIASYVPARRATKIDPMRALRCD